MKTLTQNTLCGLLFTGFIAIYSSNALATTVTYDLITSNSGIDLSGQLGTTVTETTGGIEFTFTNDVDSETGIYSSITDIYFDVGTNTDLFTGIQIAGISGDVSFDTSAAPPNLPGGQNYDFAASFSADSNSPIKSNGIDASTESLTILATLGSGFSTFGDFLYDLAVGNFRLGLHVQSIGGNDGDSDSYISTVPVPAAGILFGSALVGLGLFGRRKKKTVNDDIVGAFTRAS